MKTRIAQVYFLYIMRGWREDKDWGGLLLVYREDEKKQGLFKFTP